MSDMEVPDQHEPDPDELRDAAEARSRQRSRGHCRCGGTEMPGSCPGPTNCPMVGPEDRDE